MVQHEYTHSDVAERRMLDAVSGDVTVWCSVVQYTYSDVTECRVFIQHLHKPKPLAVRSSSSNDGRCVDCTFYPQPHVALA